MDAKITRRGFMKIAVAAAVAAIGAAAGYTQLEKFSQSPTTGRLVETTTSSASAQASAKAKVSIAKGTSATSKLKLVEKALEPFGGIEKLVPQGSSVLVKPNVAFYDKEASTDPEILANIVALVKKTNPKRIVVGESSVRGVDTWHAFQVSGVGKAAESAGAEVKDLRKDQAISIDLPKGVAIRKVDVWKTARDSTFLICVPRLKRHASTTLTVSLKNMMGIITDGEKGRFHATNLDQSIADLNTEVKPNLVIVDATQIMTERGPTGGKMVDLNTVIASTDPVAADLIAAKKLFEVEGAQDSAASAQNVAHIKKAGQLGVGVGDFTNIEVIENVVV